MFNVQLRPEVRKELKDPDGFASGLGIVYAGLTITMAGVLICILYTSDAAEEAVRVVLVWWSMPMASAVGKSLKPESRPSRQCGIAVQLMPTARPVTAPVSM